MIGNTTEEIAENKAGIIKPGCTVVSAEQLPPVTGILKTRAAESGCPFTQASSDQALILQSDHRGILLSYKEFDHIHTSMAGSYQTDNLITALEVIRALKTLGYDINSQAVRDGAEHAAWPGRFTCIGEPPVFILDGAHNEDAALRLRETVEDYFPGRELHFIMGVFKDKDYNAITRIMCPLASSVYTVDLPDQGRGLPAQELARAVRPHCPHVRAYTGSGASVRRAVTSALQEAGPEDVILAFGSLSYLHQVKDAYDRAVTGGNKTAADGNSSCLSGKERGRDL